MNGNQLYRIQEKFGYVKDTDCHGITEKGEYTLRFIIWGGSKRRIQKRLRNIFLFAEKHGFIFHEKEIEWHNGKDTRGRGLYYFKYKNEQS